ERLMTELDFQSCWLNTGMKFSREICLGEDEVMAKSPTYRAIVERVSEFFGVTVVRTLVNLYRDGDDWCNLHSDQYHQGGYPIDLTIGASFGDPRRLIYAKKKNEKHRIEIPQRNGDVFAFSDRINTTWRHMIPQEGPECGPRLSVIVWCSRKRQEETKPAADSQEPKLGRFPHMLYFNPKGSGRDFVAHAGGKAGGKGGGKGGREAGRGDRSAERPARQQQQQQQRPTTPTTQQQRSGSTTGGSRPSPVALAGSYPSGAAVSRSEPRLASDELEEAAASVRKAPVIAILAQETRIKPAHLNSVRHFMKDRGWAAHAGPQPTVASFVQNGRTMHRQPNGGTANFVRLPAVGKLYDVGGPFVEMSQWVCHTWILIESGARGVHVLNVYLPSGADASASRQRIMELVFDYASLFHGVSVFICGDLQDELSACSACAAALCTDEWHDCVDIGNHKFNREPVATFSHIGWADTHVGHKRTRIDHVICNAVAVQYVHDCRVRHDFTFPGHAVLELTITTQPYHNKCYVWSKPKSFGILPTKPSSDDEWDAANERARPIVSDIWSELSQAVHSADIGQVWEIVCKAAVAYIGSEIEREQGRSVVGIVRGELPHFVLEDVVPPHDEFSDHAPTNAQELKYIRLLESLRELRTKCEVLNATQSSGQQVSASWRLKLSKSAGQCNFPMAEMRVPFP
ncbi:unnamed protein product, partial [Polarella glacialis]